MVEFHGVILFFVLSGFLVGGILIKLIDKNGIKFSILKTFWIRLIQRKLKNILLERSKILEKRCNVIAIVYREIYGTWPDGCLHYPRLTGMLSNLKS